MTTSTTNYFSFSMDIADSKETLTVFRPTVEEAKAHREVAKKIFVEAFTARYTEAHLKRSVEPIEKWLQLKEGLPLKKWLKNTFDDEFNEYLDQKKLFVFLKDSNQKIVGWMSHGVMSSEGVVYLSQGCLSQEWRNKGVSKIILSKLLQEKNMDKLLPGIRQATLIARKINDVADHLYSKAGFIRDEEIDPKVYGDSYDERYVGYRIGL